MKLSFPLITVFVLLNSVALAHDFEEFGFSDQDEWFATVEQAGPLTTIGDFGQFPAGTVIHEQYARDGVHFPSGAGVLPLKVDGVIHYAAVAFGGIEIVFDSPQYWFGTDFFGGFLNAEVYFDGDLLFDEQLPISTPLGFAGLISRKPFDRIILDDPGDHYLGIETLWFGAPVVPAPGALIVLLAGTAISARRRR